MPEIHDGSDHNPLGLQLVEDAIGEVPDQHPPVTTTIHRSDLRMLTQKGQRSVQVPHKHFAPPWLALLVPREGGLSVLIGFEKEGSGPSSPRTQNALPHRFPSRELLRVLPKVGHPAIQLRKNLPRDGDFGRVGFQVVPQLRDEDQFLRRGQPLYFWKLLKNHAPSISTLNNLATAGERRKTENVLQELIELTEKQN